MEKKAIDTIFEGLKNLSLCIGQGFMDDLNPQDVQIVLETAVLKTKARLAECLTNSSNGNTA